MKMPDMIGSSTAKVSQYWLLNIFWTNINADERIADAMIPPLTLFDTLRPVLMTDTTTTIYMKRM